MKRLLLIVLSTVTAVLADSTINDTQKFAWAANAGWVNLRPSTANGLSVGEFVCAGYGYGANFGWINFGSGAPQNGIRYSNTNAADVGVNLQPGGALRGQAWGANVGWIRFETNGNPRVDYATGRLLGYAWGANLGWINLNDLTYYVKTDVIQPGADSDNDGITDAWERERANSLTALNAIGDADGDGVSDRAEYFADTNPLNNADQFRITGFQSDGDPATQISLTWKSRPSRCYSIEARESFDTAPDTGSWREVGIGALLGVEGGTQTQALSGTVVTNPFYHLRVLLPLHP